MEELWRQDAGLAHLEERVLHSYSLEPPDWLLGMTDEFRKGIAVVDRKLQGRILEAMSYIARTPLSPKGDTVKALSGELKELWRYRIGDYRLVYRPDESRKQVMLVAFTSRGDSYG
jgi:mRNA-degrading endonuclease RelE of RelBE toxin-antitoxin system